MLVSIAISVYGNLQTANLHTTTVIIFVILHRGWAKTHKKSFRGMTLYMQISIRGAQLIAMLSEWAGREEMNE